MTLADLRSSVRYTVFGDSSETLYADTDLDRNINLWYKTAISWILKSNGDWQVNGAVATTNIVADQRRYLIPSDILKINEVYIKYGSGSEYVKAKQRDPANLGGYDPDSYSYQPSPPEFDLQGNYIKIYVPEETISASDNGLKIHYQTEVTALSGTTDYPNLAEPFEKILILGASYEYCIANEMGKAEQIKRDLREVRADLLEFYATRSTAQKIRIIPSEQNNY